MEEYSEELIEEIKENIDIVDFISEYVDLDKRGANYFGICPFHNEATASFCVTPSTKSYHCFGCDCHGDVIAFYREFFNKTFNEAIKYLSGIAGVSASAITISPTIKYLRKLNREKTFPKPEPHAKINDDILSTFEYGNIKEWQKEGIPQEIMNQYGVGFDRKNNRIVYPVYDCSGNLINIKGRTLEEDYKKKGLPKYINYYKVGDLDYFQGMYKKSLLMNNYAEIILFESFKSVMKADSYGFLNSVSVETHSINYYQLQILIGLKKDVIIAFDADVPLKTIKNDNEIRILSRFTNVYIIYDFRGLLGDKSLKCAPVDCGKEIWEELYKGRIKYS